jgi:hypothetical protein
MTSAASEQQDSYRCRPKEAGYAWWPNVQWVHMRGALRTVTGGAGAAAKHGAGIKTQQDVRGYRQRSHDRNHNQSNHQDTPPHSSHSPSMTVGAQSSILNISATDHTLVRVFRRSESDR